ncbi:MAG: hypothetical protein COS72_03515 [Candidatus Moranbacteria bacterium CG06_land_8_20_14_3_00_43_56]|nr:MAG: hypothetical protein COS72_03515 [Candidatus Moranbacteria bacterium CG06_land_8_20_14_3_00_43_56]
MEEERRLCYVGITRAKKRVYLLWTTTRNIFGSVRVNVASRFLEDVPEELISGYEKLPGKEKTGKVSSKKEIIYNFKDGERVSHPAFGEGVVISAKDDIVTVAFMKAGVKKISAKFGKLKKV